MSLSHCVVEALEAARKLIYQVGFSQAPVDIHTIARKVGVDLIEAQEMTADGYLGKQKDGTLVIRYRIGNSRPRNRFTIAHEVGHILLNQVQKRNIVGENKRECTVHWEERAANRIAAELLMPEPWFQMEFIRREYEGKRPSWAFIKELARQFRVSEDAVIYRVLEMPRLAAVLVRVCINGTSPRFPYNFSENALFQLAYNVSYEVDRLWREAKRSNQHCISIVNPHGQKELSCEGRMRTLTTRRGISEQYWIIGWTMIDDLQHKATYKQIPMVLDTI